MSGAQTTRRPWLPVVVLVAFGLFFSYDLFEGISNAIAVVQSVNANNEFIEGTGVAPFEIPWIPVAAYVLVAPVFFTIAALLGRGRSLGTRALILLTGLAATSAFGLTIVSAATLF